jgi:hypothetical protein
MTEEETDARQAWLEMIYRSRALVDDWEELKRLGADAARYC